MKDPKAVEQFRKKLKKPSLGKAAKKAKAPMTLKEEAEQAKAIRAKRRKQEKLRRQIRIGQKQKENATYLLKLLEQGIDPSTIEDDGGIRCTACGLPGHMKTNRECPLYVAKEDSFHKNTKNTILPISSPNVEQNGLVLRLKIKTPSTTKAPTKKRVSFDNKTTPTTNKKRPKKTKDNSDEEDYSDL